MFQVKVFWVVTPCSDVAGYQCFRGHNPENLNLRLFGALKFYFALKNIHYPSFFLSDQSTILLSSQI